MVLRVKMKLSNELRVVARLAMELVDGRSLLSPASDHPLIHVAKNIFSNTKSTFSSHEFSSMGTKLSIFDYIVSHSACHVLAKDNGIPH